MLTVAAMLTNMMAETTCASVAASSGLVRRRAPGRAAIASSVCTVRASASRWWGSCGVAEDDLAQVRAPVVDLHAVALDDRPDDRDHRLERVGDDLGGGSPSASAST